MVIFPTGPTRYCHSTSFTAQEQEQVFLSMYLERKRYIAVFKP